MANARRLVAAGAEFVKAEGGREILPQVQAIVAAGIPFCGHLGMLPQHVLEEGGYHIKGKKDAEHQRLLEDAKALADAGAFAIVLELVTPPVAKEISQSISVPTIGIGSGPDCDGQILVTHDLTGTFSVVHAALCETEGELRGGNQVGGGGVEKLRRIAGKIICRETIFRVPVLNLPMKILFAILMLALAAAGCTTKSKARLKAAERLSGRPKRGVAAASAGRRASVGRDDCRARCKIRRCRGLRD